MKKVKILAVGLAVLASVLASQSASAFKAHITGLGGLPIHQEITQESLGFTLKAVLADMQGEHEQATGACSRKASS